MGGDDDEAALPGERVEARDGQVGEGGEEFVGAHGLTLRPARKARLAARAIARRARFREVRARSVNAKAPASGDAGASLRHACPRGKAARITPPGAAPGRGPAAARRRGPP
ncbi:hypothetical protein AwMethylo_06830 [Methylobacterium sp.]|nr:hypothetical protein AwMethylo_06830 [Methylobacterium sp.]